MSTPQTLFQLHLQSISACPDARQWAGSRTAKQAWDECERADWLLWWAIQAGVNRKEIVKVTTRMAPHADACTLIRIGLPQPWTEPTP